MDLVNPDGPYLLTRLFQGQNDVGAIYPLGLFLKQNPKLVAEWGHCVPEHFFRFATLRSVKETVRNVWRAN